MITLGTFLKDVSHMIYWIRHTIHMKSQSLIFAKIKSEFTWNLSLLVSEKKKKNQIKMSSNAAVISALKIKTIGDACLFYSDYLAYANLSVILRRRLDVAGWQMLTFTRVLPHRKSSPRHLIWYSIQSHYTDTELTSPRSIFLMLCAKPKSS